MANKLNFKMAIRAVLLVGGSGLLACTQMTLAIDEPSSESGCQTECNPLRNPYFGELHVHTKYSLDSYIKGNNNDPEDAYRFAKGEKALPIGNSGVEIKITRPLDFAAVTDHAETMAEYLLCVEEGIKLEGVKDIPEKLICRLVKERSTRLHKRTKDNLYVPQPEPNQQVCPPPEEGEEDVCRNASMTMWQRYQTIADEHNDPGNFTTFAAYEHSPYTITVGTFHRNVIFRGTGEGQVPDNVISAYDVYTASELWKQLEDTCTGDCEVLLIPHNANISQGMFFAKKDRQNHKPLGGADLPPIPDVLKDTITSLPIPDEKKEKISSLLKETITPPPNPYTEEDYERRKRLEPLIEIHQMKGNSECLLGAGTTDEFCQFETTVRPVCNKFDQKSYPEVNCVDDSYVRNGLKKGLELAGNEDMNGLNPFQYGFVGGTDGHNGTPGATEEFQLVNSGPESATPEQRLFGAKYATSTATALAYNPGGLTGVWAEENTRDAIFDALKRKEVFATSGSRITVRFFAGWNYQTNLHQYPKETMLEEADKNGIPMGGDLTPVKYEVMDDILNKEPVPKFLVWAAKDPLSANLQRLQIIKGWEDKDGTHEKVYDVACSNGLKPDKWTHRCPDNGAQVDSACNPSANKGATELKTTWRDPDFEPSRRAFYYVRVLENPTCRWSTIDANTLGIEPLDDIPPTIQERAWSSPIWYTPLPAAVIAEKLQTNPREAIAKLLQADKSIPWLLLKKRAVSAIAKLLPNSVVEARLKGKTVIYRNLRDGSRQEIFFSDDGKRIVEHGPDHMVATSYEIRDGQLYERIGDKEYSTSIYRVKGKSGFRYIACDSGDNGYCNWEIIQP